MVLTVLVSKIRNASTVEHTVRVSNEQLKVVYCLISEFHTDDLGIFRPEIIKILFPKLLSVDMQPNTETLLRFTSLDYILARTSDTNERLKQNWPL